MCGRYTIYTNKEALEERFHAEMMASELYKKHFNAAPSQYLPVVESNAPEMINFSYWGFTPSWMKKDSKIKPMINARGETVAEKPMFRGSFKHKRCLVLTDGFYEWDRVGDEKIPYYIRLKDKKPFAFAGIWDESEEEDRQPNTFAIITTNANALMQKIHHRMPVILHPEDEKKWLDEGLKTEDALRLLKGYPSKDMEMYEVSKAVNSPRNDSEKVIEKV